MTLRVRLNKMEDFFEKLGVGKRTIVVALILAIFLTFFLFVLGRPRKVQQGMDKLRQTPGQETTNQEGTSISHFFENMVADEEGKTFISPTPRKGKRVECVLEGIKMQEGTVASDTVCVSEP